MFYIVLFVMIFAAVLYHQPPTIEWGIVLGLFYIGHKISLGLTAISEELTDISRFIDSIRSILLHKNTEKEITGNIITAPDGFIEKNNRKDKEEEAI